MAENDVEVEEITDVVSEDTNSAPQTKGRRSFRNVRRELSEKELSSPGAQKLLLDDLERLEGELEEAKRFRERFHAADKNIATLEGQLVTKNRNELLYNGSVIGGSVLFGFAPNVWDQGLTGIYVLLAGAVITGTALYTHWVKK
ncbi:hypothetical protein [Shinella fusca]|uniref:Uncharacterized protein n=1 Tax=Shinella fusca TaxID=544480 RepID=A0A7W7YXF3_9HYPH|nr:hypothetical protein [Shinella fusca]MBB5044032.1 hypothetical protein [Shinella fusca]